MTGLLLEFGMAAAGFLLGWFRFFVKRFSPPSPISPAKWAAPIWTVKVVPATCAYDFYSRERGSQPVEGVVSVRIVRGEETHPIGTVKIASADFDGELQRLRTLAEDRASTLNAHEDLA